MRLLARKGGRVRIRLCAEGVEDEVLAVVGWLVGAPLMREEEVRLY